MWLLQRQVSPFLQQVFMPLVLAIFEVLGRPAEENDQAAALEKQMLRRSYFTFIQTITGSGMNEVMGNQGECENIQFCSSGRIKKRAGQLTVQYSFKPDMCQNTS